MVTPRGEGEYCYDDIFPSKIAQRRWNFPHFHNPLGNTYRMKPRHSPFLCTIYPYITITEGIHFCFLRHSRNRIVSFRPTFVFFVCRVKSKSFIIISSSASGRGNNCIIKAHTRYRQALYCIFFFTKYRESLEWMYCIDLFHSAISYVAYLR